MANQNQDRSNQQGKDQGRSAQSQGGARNENASGNDRRGFAGMDEEKQRQIASEGGRAAHQSGNAHEFDSEEAREAGRKGGQATARNRSNDNGNAGNGSSSGSAGNRDRQGAMDGKSGGNC